MKRLTTDDSKSILCGLNLFFAKDGEVWIRGGGPEPDYQDCTLVDYIVRAAETHHLNIVSRDVENLGDEMYDCLQYGTEELEGVVALLHAAAVQAAEMRGRLAPIEDILGDSYDLDRLQELVETDRDGRCEVLPCKPGDTINAFRLGDKKKLCVISDMVTSVTTNKYGWTIKTKSKFLPIKEADGNKIARISQYPYALADYYVGPREAAEAALRDQNGGAV